MDDQNQIPKPQTIRRVGKDDIIPGTIEPRHMAANNAVVSFGLSANRPKVGTNYCLAYFATDTGVLSIWNKQAWKSTTLS